MVVIRTAYIYLGSDGYMDMGMLCHVTQRILSRTLYRERSGLGMTLEL